MPRKIPPGGGGEFFDGGGHDDATVITAAPEPVGARGRHGMDDLDSDTIPPRNYAAETGPDPYLPPPARQTPPRMARSAGNEKLSALKSLALDHRPDSAATMPTRSAKLPWILLLLVLGGIGVNWYVLPRLHSSAASDKQTPTPGSNEPATEVVQLTTSGGKPLHAAGYVAVRAPIVVGSVIAGRVKALLVHEGDSVTKNQVLAQLDDSAALADYTLARARLRDAQRILERTQQLRKVEGATAADLDRAVGQVEIARASLAPIERQMNDAKIRAPVDGTIMEELVQPGSIIVGNAGVFRLADLSKLVAEIDVNEADVSLVQIDQKVDVTSDAFPDRTFSGVVRELGEQVDRAKGTATVKVFLDTPPKTLRPGMSVKATFQPIEGKSRMLISKTAVDASGNVSLVGADGKISTTHVNIQSAGPTRVEVLDGLKEGDRIIVDASKTPRH